MSMNKFKSSWPQVPAMQSTATKVPCARLPAGRGVHSEQFSRYEQMSREIEQREIDEANNASRQQQPGALR